MDILSTIAGLFKPAAKLIDDLHVSDEERGKLRNALATIQANMQKESIKLMTAEANSKYMLTSIWRPICALVLFALILLDGFGAISAPPQVYELAQVFLGAYAGGRSLEKVAKAIKS